MPKYTHIHLSPLLPRDLVNQDTLTLPESASCRGGRHSGQQPQWVVWKPQEEPTGAVVLVGNADRARKMVCAMPGVW